MRDCWLDREHECATAAGIVFQRLPIPNLLTLTVAEGLPRIEGLAAEVRAGRGVAAHCFASVGRAPTIVASVLVILGLEPGDAWRRVQSARGKLVPDTDLQRHWVGELRAYRDSLRANAAIDHQAAAPGVDPTPW